MSDTSFRLPQSLVTGLLLYMIASAATGIYYVATKAAQGDATAEAVQEIKTELQNINNWGVRIALLERDATRLERVVESLEESIRSLARRDINDENL